MDGKESEPNSIELPRFKLSVTQFGDPGMPEKTVSVDTPAQRPSEDAAEAQDPAEETTDWDTETTGIDDDDDQAEIENKKRKAKTLRQKVWLFLRTPGSSKPAMLWAAWMVICILTSTFVFLIGSMPEYTLSPPPSLFVLECIVITFFTLEYTAKLVCAPKIHKFVIEPLSIIDVVSIVPFYIELALESANVKGLAVVRVLRLLRVLRMLRLGAYSPTVKVIGQTVKRSRDGMALLLFCVALLAVVFSSCLFYAEQSTMEFDAESEQWLYDDTGEPSAFQSIPGTFWWCIITMTTVGYGDAYPRSPAGKFVASVTALTALMVIAFPITIMVTNFNDSWNEMKEAQRLKRLRRRAKKKRLFSTVRQTQAELLTELEHNEVAIQQALGAHEKDLAEMAKQMRALRDKQDLLSETITKLRLLSASSPARAPSSPRTERSLDAPQSRRSSVDAQSLRRRSPSPRRSLEVSASDGSAMGAGRVDGVQLAGPTRRTVTLQTPEVPAVDAVSGSSTRTSNPDDVSLP